MGQAIRAIAQRFEMSERPGPRVPLTQTARAGANPEQTTGILKKRENVVATEARLICRIIGKQRKFAGVRVQQVKSFVGSYPELPAVILEYDFDSITADTRWHRRIVRERFGLTRQRIDPDQAVLVATQPKHTVPANVDITDAYAVISGGFDRTEVKVLNRASGQVEAVEPGTRGDPQLPIATRRQRVDLVTAD